MTVTKNLSEEDKDMILNEISLVKQDIISYLIFCFKSRKLFFIQTGRYFYSLFLPVNDRNMRSQEWSVNKMQPIRNANKIISESYWVFFMISSSKTNMRSNMNLSMKSNDMRYSWISYVFVFQPSTRYFYSLFL